MKFMPGSESGIEQKLQFGGNLPKRMQEISSIGIIIIFRINVMEY
jgi:hypothetical protein